MFNAVTQHHQKDHWMDAACVGDSGNQINIKHIKHIGLWKAVGRGNRQMCLMNKCGFPRTRSKTVKRYLTPIGQSFQTGDQVKLTQPSGKYKGVYRGVVCVRATGQFDITTKQRKISANVKNFKTMSVFNGYHVKQQVLGT